MILFDSENHAHLIIRVDDENIELEALRELQYEGTPAEVAQGLKEQGNEMVKLKRWKDGQEFYTKAIAVLTQKARAEFRDEQEERTQNIDVDQVKEQGHLTETCHVNRALCNLRLSKFSLP